MHAAFNILYKGVLLRAAGNIFTTLFSPSTPIFLSIIANAPQDMLWHEPNMAATVVESGIWTALKHGCLVSCPQ